MLTPSAPAQQAEESPERAEPVFLDVLVQDSDLQLVSGLRADEFVIYEDEVRHQVTLLEAAGPNAERTGRIHPVVLALVGDEAPGTEILTAAARALRLQMKGSDQVCIFRLGKQLRLLHPFSSDAEELVAALQSSEPGQLLPEGPLSEADLDSNPFALAEGRLQLAQRIQRLFYATSTSLRRSAESSFPALIQAAARGLSGIQGRKTLVLLGKDQVSTALPPAEVDRTLELANAFHLAVYSLDEAPPPPSRDGRETAPPRSGNQASPLRLIVNSSCGMILNQDDLASQVERVFQEAHQHYRIFYRSRKQNADGRYRQLRVQVNRVGLEARYRTGYPARPPGLELLSQSEIEALGTIREAQQSNPRAAWLRADVLPTASVGQRALVTLGIPAASLHFYDLSDQGREGRLCRFQTIALLRDASGAVLQTSGGPLSLALEPASFGVVERDGLAVTGMLDLAPGKYVLEAGLLDELGGGGAWLERDLQVGPPSQEPALGPILLGRQDRSAIRGRDWAPIGIPGFVPAAKSSFPAAGWLSFVIESRHPKDSPQAELHAFLENALGARSALEVVRAESQPQMAQGRLDLSELAPGKYTLVVESSGLSDGAKAESRAPFEIAEPQS